MEVRRTKSNGNEQFTPALAGARHPTPKPETGGRAGMQTGAGKTPDASYLEKWGKLAIRRKTNEKQHRYLYRIAKNNPDIESRHIALKAAAALHFCNQLQIVRQEGEHFTPVGSYNCGKKYCAVCSNKKRRKLLAIFGEFFESDEGRELLKNYDPALFTITLQHKKHGLRANPYYKELSTHFRNALKYGAFRSIIAGGFYNTEHTYTKNGHHIHRHALILIPRRFDVFNNWETLQEQLRQQWKSRTGGSFQIDLKPLGFDRKNNTATPRAGVMGNIRSNLLEITKYITKRDESGVIDWNIIKAVEQNNRAKFYGRFGILHNVKKLNLNNDLEEVETDEPKPAGQLFTCNIYVKFDKVKGERTATRRKIRTTGGKIPRQKIYIIRGEKIVTWKRRGISYTAKNLQPFSNTPEARRQLKEGISLSIFKWRLEKTEKLAQGYDVKKWKEGRTALERLGRSLQFTQDSINFAEPF